MNPKNVMMCIAVVTSLVGLGFIIFPIQITNQIFPSIGEEAIVVGVFHRQVIGSMVLVFSIYHWFMRDAEEEIAKRFLFASGICFLLNALMLIKVSVIDGVTTFPFPPFVLLVILSGTTFYVSKKKTAKEELIAEIKEKISDK